MSSMNAKSLRTGRMTGLDMEAFRSEREEVAVVTGVARKAAPSGMGSKDAKVSEYGLEGYLNACAPTCHG